MKRLNEKNGHMDTFYLVLPYPNSYEINTVEWTAVYPCHTPDYVLNNCPNQPADASTQ